MTQIKKITGHEILDSRGNPTVEVNVALENGTIGRAAIPSGASTGIYEALELRDGDKTRYNGKGVLKAVDNVNKIIGPKLIGMDPRRQQEIDEKMIELDGTENKEKLGANAILGVSLASCRAAALDQQIPLYKYLAGDNKISLPVPMFNIVNGGAHANNNVDIQEFMVIPVGVDSMRQRIESGVNVYQALKTILEKQGHSTAVGDEGGFAPNLKSNEEALELIVQAIEKAGYKPGIDMSIALDCAASYMFKDGNYLVSKKTGSTESRTPEQQVDYYAELCKAYPITSIEDGHDENDWDGWKTMTDKLGDKIQIVGDDLFVTNPKFLKKGIDQGIANAILIKLNQIGTLTETINVMKMAKEAGYKCVVSHRSGETEDTFIADFAVGTNAGQIKTGAPCRSERVAKYNQLLRIEEELGLDVE